MTDRLDSLKALREKVRAGEQEPPFWKVWMPEGQEGSLAYVAWDAYRGSLDAAKTLHTELLKGWEYGITKNADQPEGCAAYVSKWGDDEVGFEASNDNPARAWLLAILSALIAIEEGKA